MQHVYFNNTFERSFGTFPLKAEVLTDALATAIDTGYRSIDTAQMYENEADVGRALKQLDVPREELCITTKIHPDNFSAERFVPSLRRSLSDLEIDQVDVLLLHWPPVGGDVEPSLNLLAEAREQGLTKHIGVSNYNAAMMRRAVEILDVPLVCNQVEFHPLLDQRVLLQASVETGIPLSSYCSVARGEVFKYPLFDELAQSYAKTAAQIALRWILQKGVPINTMSTKAANIRASFDLMDFTLSSADMARIDALTATAYRIVTSDLVPWAPEWD